MTWVDADSQGHKKGIRPDWIIKTINGVSAKKSRKKVLEQIEIAKKSGSYTIGFIVGR